ncbi:MAG: class I SAM-dependent methyltransferase [Chitinophagaceae bacterium]|nr:class I SAM-dependent methyltransferase [Chitinophagaceae bacterium]
MPCFIFSISQLIRDVISSYVDIENKNILHFSPEKNLYKFLKAKARIITVDIAPAFYLNIDDAIRYADATRLQFNDQSFDLLIPNHILEHIPDDRAAMKEMYRVLRDDGLAILQVPYSETLSSTIEGPFINDPHKQEFLYGQKDHVRIYSRKDYIDRLQECGFCVTVLTPGDLAAFKNHAVQEEESV